MTQNRGNSQSDCRPNAISIFTIVERLGLPSSTTDIEHIGTRLAQQFDFEHFIFAVRIPLPIDDPKQLVWTNFPAEWVNRYSSERLVEEDPIVLRCNRSLAPFFWDEVIYNREHLAYVLKISRTFGLVHGVTIPLHAAFNQAGAAPNSQALLTLARRTRIGTDARMRFELISQMLLIGSVLHDFVLIDARADVSSTLRSKHSLTKRERQCLTLAARGLTGVEIARELGVTPKTVAFHLDHCREKLGAESRHAAVAEAVRLREIGPKP